GTERLKMDMENTQAGDDPRAGSVARFRLIDEWHLNFVKLFEHLTFEFAPRPRQAVVPLGPPLGHAGLEAVGSVGDSVDSDGPKDLLTDCRPLTRTAVGLEGNQGLESRQDPERRHRGATRLVGGKDLSEEDPESHPPSEDTIIPSDL